MESKNRLQEFLDKHKAEGILSHTSMTGGKYFIGNDEIDEFYKLYLECILDGNKLYLTEKPQEVGPLRVDLDFIYDQDPKGKHLHTQDQVLNFVNAYLVEMQKYLNVPESSEVYVMEKRRPTFDAKKNRYKSGIHIVVPNVCTHKYVEQSVRRSLVKRMDEFFPNLPIKDSWEKVYDEAVLNRSQQWTLYGSQKNDIDSQPYKTSYIVNWKNDKDFTISTDVPNIGINLIKKLSLREEKPETPMTEEGKKSYGAARSPSGNDVRISGGKPRVGRPARRGEKPSSRGSSPNGRIFIQLEPEVREYLKSHVMNLNPERADKYDTWIQVAICLHNIHPDLLDVFLDFSSQCEQQYNEADCIQKWNALTFRNDGDRLGEGTLRFWSREDDREGYDEIEKNNIERLVVASRSCTEHDVAAVIYGKYRDNYKCSDFKNNIWYRWTGHIWRETDSGVDLLMKLSKQVADIFFKKAAAIMKEMGDRELTECNYKVEKKDCGECEYCLLEKERTDYIKVFTQLKKTAFKANVMKECRELFFDEEFTKKVDANKDLIAFNNGVLDMTKETFTFRDGKPEDYISFSTGIDYDQNRNYYDYPAWPAVEQFISKVLPDTEVREYFMKHLASNLSGGNTAQKFHIMTGSGSNGKSMIMNLMGKALGDYSCTVPISLFTQKRKGSGAAAPEVARLKGRRFVTMQEPDESIALNTGLMKEITSGEKMYARDLFKSGSEFEIQAKFHLACNDKPKINTTDGGTWRRLVVINFVSKFVPNPKEANEYPLDESIQFSVNSTEWATPFLSYMVHVLKEGKGLRKLPAPAKVLEYTSDYRNENDGIAKFIAEKIASWEEGDPVVQIDKPTLKRVFKIWKDENDLKLLSPVDLEKRIESQFGKYPRGGWTNFKLDV